LKNIVVIGGGIIGLSTAFYLQLAGHRVTVLDKGDFSDNCSYGNAGYVCPGHFIPLAAPGIIWKGLKWMFNSKSPFYVKPSLNATLIDWGLKFARSASQRNVDEAAIPLRDIALLSKQEYESWTRLPGFEFAFESKGLLEIFQTQKVADHAQHTVEKGRELGLDVELLNYERLQKMEPHTRINGMGAIYFKCDAHLYPEKLMHCLLTYLPQNNVRLIANEEVKNFEKKGDKIRAVVTDANRYEADEVVIATGAWSRELATMAGIKIPMMPGRGYSVTLTDSPYRLNYPAILAEGRVAITPMDGNKIRFGGTMEVVKTNTAPRYERVEGILRSVKRFFPEFDIAMPPVDKLWYGYRPCSADGLPYIGRTQKFKNLVIATGHSMLGLSLGAGTGKLVGEIIDEKPTSMSMDFFAPERFG
jgi:D-amino-acid dehydrogenase